MRFVSIVGVIAVLVVIVLLIHLQLGAPPDPRVGGCDPNDMLGTQTMELVRLSNWLLVREVLGALLVAAIAYALLYLQVFHRWAGPLAWLGRLTIIGGLALVAGLSVKGLAQAWIANNGGTCLSEAIQSNPTGIAAIGRVVPVSWPWAVCVDGVALAFFGAMLGVLAYSAARHARA